MSLMNGGASAIDGTVRTTVAIAWSIAREAVRRGRPDLDLPPARGGDVQLCLTIDAGRCSAALRDPATGRSHPIELGAVRVETVRAGEFVHIDVREQGRPVLSATWRQDSGEDRLLYARTPLLERLGVRGGRYNRPTIES